MVEVELHATRQARLAQVICIWDTSTQILHITVRHPSAGRKPVEQQVDGDLRHGLAAARRGRRRPPRLDRDRDALGASGVSRCCGLPRISVVLGTLRNGDAAALPPGLQARGDLAEPEADRVGRRRGPKRRHGVRRSAPAAGGLRL